INQNSRIKNDSAIGIVFSSAFAIGVILIAQANSSIDLNRILFGSVLSVKTSDMWMTLIIGAIVLLTVIIFYKELLVSTFDPTFAASYGLPNKFIYYLVMILLTLVTVASLLTDGSILVVELVIAVAHTYS